MYKGKNKGETKMKLITAVINKKDINEVCHSLTESGFYFTRMASVGGFLTSGNTTLIIGTEDDQVDAAIEIIRNHCSRRVETVPSTIQMGIAASSFPTEVIVGGATVFVTDVEHFEKI